MTTETQNENIPPDIETFDYIKTIKTNIRHVLNDDHASETLNKINDIVLKTNKIVTHTYQFIKLYLLFLSEKCQEFPIINKQFVSDVFVTITIRKNKQGQTSNHSEQQINLRQFYIHHYKQTIFDNEELFYDKMSYVLPYEANDIVKNINNNIKMHYFRHLKTLINYSFNKKGRSDDIKNKFKNAKDSKLRKQAYQELNQELQDIMTDIISVYRLKSNQEYHQIIFERKQEFIAMKEDKDKIKLVKMIKMILNFKSKKKSIKKIQDDDVKKRLNNLLTLEVKNMKDDFEHGFYSEKSLPKYRDWVNEHKHFLVPNKDHFDNNSIPYDLESNTQDYLMPFIYIGKQLEILNIPRIEEETQIRLFNIIPLRTNIIPKHITIDTCAIIQNFLEPMGSGHLLANYKHISGLQDIIWNEVFCVYDDIFLNRNRGSKRKHIKQKESRIKFKSDQQYNFHYMIKTDGVSVSILFIKLDRNGVPYKHDDKQYTPSNDNEYIEKTIITEEMRRKTIVCADPNKSDLILLRIER